MKSVFIIVLSEDDVKIIVLVTQNILTIALECIANLLICLKLFFTQN